MSKNKQSTGNRATFTGGLGYVLATAGASVGLGNIWRFPYLAAKYGGGIFLLTYLILALTFGYSMVISETALGRMTGKSPVGAFRAFHQGLVGKFGGWINAIIPILILPYYSVIGGWVTKYLYEYIAGHGKALAGDEFFGSFIGNSLSAELWFIVFTCIVVVIIIGGVEKGVERVSKIMMPILVCLSLIVAVYTISRPGAIGGVKYFLVPDFKNFSWMTIVAAMGQMFYSLSIAMGILITYGSYMKKHTNIEKASIQVALFDSGIAVMSGLMIIPAVFAFAGGNPGTLNAGPSLMFITLPKVFASMGMGGIFGLLFFLLVLFAAVTSAIALAETSTSTFQDELGWSRGRSSLTVGVIMVALGSLSSLGYSALGNVRILGMQILDFFDFLTNSLMMPVAAFCICVFVVAVVGREKIAEEVRISSNFRLEKVYNFIVKFIAPIFLLIILLSSLASVFGLLSI